MSGLLTVPFTFAGLFDLSHRDLFWGLALCALFITTLSLCLRITPKLSPSFSKDASGCIMKNVTLSVNSPTGVHQILCDYYRVKLKTRLVDHIMASGRLVSIKKNGIEVFSGENLELTIAPASRTNPLIKEVFDGTEEYLDVMAITHSNDILITTQGFSYPSSFNVQGIFSQPADYLLRIIITSPSSTHSFIELLFKWTGNWSTAQMSCHKVSP